MDIEGRHLAQAALTAYLGGERDRAIDILMESDAYTQGVVLATYLDLFALVDDLLREECQIDFGGRLSALFVELAAE